MPGRFQGTSMKLIRLLAAVFLLCTAAWPQQPSDHTWDAWKFLLGAWDGQGGGQPGQGSGTFSFALDLQGKVLVRKNHSDYPATKERAAYSHDDLMIVYVDPDTKDKRAFWTDSDGHVIHYSAFVSSDGRVVTFISDVLPAAPRYRFTYTQTQPNQVGITFEVAPPGNPGKFSRYIAASAVKKANP